MKRELFFSVIVICSMMVNLLGASNSTPVISGTKVSASASSPGSAIHTFNERLRAAMIQINKDQKSGKLSKNQVESARAQVKAIRKQELADYKANGKSQLTADQLSSLNASLDSIQSSL